MKLRRLSGPPILILFATAIMAAAAVTLLPAQGTPVTGGCAGGALGAAHDQPGVVCEDFDTDRNGSGSIEWSRLPRGAHPCNPLAALFDPGDDVHGVSLDGGAVPLGTDGRICSEDAGFGTAQNTCYPVPGENDWHLHSAFEGCDTDDSYDEGNPGFDASCAPNGEWAHSGMRSLHLGRHLGYPDGGLEFDTYRWRQTSAFVLDPVNLTPSSMLEFWQIIQICDDTCVNVGGGETTAGGQLQISASDPATGIFEPWQPLAPSENGYDSTPQSTIIICEFDPGDDSLAPGNETMCLDDSPQWSDMGDIHGTDVTCTVDTDMNDPNNLDCGETSNRTVDPNCSWVADPACGSFLENGSAGGGVWARTQVDLSPFSARAVRLRWVFQGGGGWGFGESRSFLESETGFSPYFAGQLDDGWYVDDIKVSGVVEPDPNCLDADQDGYACTADPACPCGPQLDCGCLDAATFPGATEICDRIDNDCDMTIPPDEIDGDGDDVVPCEGDCDDSDGGSFAPPPAVTGLEAVPDSGGAFLSWLDLAPVAGTATVYDVFSGLVSDFRNPQGYRAGDCVAEDLGSPTLVAVGDDPPPGDARYYVFRGQNACPAGTGTWGDPFRDTEINGSPHDCD